MDKISEFEQSANEAIGKKVKGFQDEHPLGDKAVKTIISILPPPFNAIAENIYTTSEGSDEDRFEKVKDFLNTIQKQGEEHYNNLSAKSDTIIQEVLSLQNKAAKEETLKLVIKMMISQSDSVNQQLEQIKENLSKIKSLQIGGDQIGYWVKGSNNIIGKNISIVNQEIKSTGLTLLESDYFESRNNVKDDFENWKKGYPFELPSIYYGYEFKRETITDEIKQRLGANYKLLLLGESGTSKSTILMEIMCDYFRNGFKVLHNLDSSQLPQANDIVQYIEPLVKGKNKLLVAIDNAHDKKMSTIFNVINQLSFIDNSKDVLVVVTARLPEYDNLVSKRQFELEDRDRLALKKFNEIPNIKYTIPYFRDANEVQEFFTFYKKKYNLDRSSTKSHSDIFNETGGHPIMVKFFLLGKGLREDVENRYKFYLFDSDTNKPIGENIQTILICALFSISNYAITDKNLDNMKVRKCAKSIIGIMRRREDGTWTTIHPRWDMELFSYLFSSKDEDEIDHRKTNLANACTSIFDLRDKQFSLSAISALYDMAGESLIPINIVNDSVRIPEYIANDKDAMYSIHAYYKGGAYYKLRMYDDVINECEEAIRIRPLNLIAFNNKGVALKNLDKYQEAIEEYDKALKIDPNYVNALYNKGVALKNLGKCQEAIEEYDKVLEIDPKYVNALSGKGVALEELGKYEQAIEEYDKALKIDPKYVNALYNKGVALKELGKYEQAIEEYDKALKIDPNYVDALYGKGVALKNLGKYQEAIEEYDKALKIDPNYVDVLYNKGVALYNLRKYEQAIEEYDKALKIDPNDVDVLYNKGVALYNLLKYEQAIEWYDKALNIDPKYVYALNNKGKALYNLGKYEQAIEEYDKALKIDPKYVNALYNKGVALKELGKYEQAIEEYDKALKIDPNYAPTLYNKGLALYNLRNYQEAIEEYDKALKIDPNNVFALGNKGKALNNLAKYEQAIEEYDKVLEIDPNNVFALGNKGKALNNLAKYEQAIEEYDKVLEIDPNYAPTLYNKGLALYNLRNYQEAMEWYDKALKIDPNNVLVLNNKGVALYNLRKYEQAIEWYDKTLNIDPNNVFALYGKGVALYNLRKYEQAIEEYDKALKIDPNNVFALYGKGLSFAGLGKNQEAIEEYDKVLEIDPNYVDAYFNKGVALGNLGKYEEAIQCSNKALGLDPKYANAWYNRSCYVALKGDIDEALKNLEEAIKLDKSNIESAKTDKDFDLIKNDDRFKKLIS